MAKVHHKIIEALDETGLPYEVLAGKKHLKVYLAGEMVQVLSRGKRSGDDSSPRQLKNATAHIRRNARRIREERGL